MLSLFKKKQEEPRKWTIIDTNYLADIENEDRFVSYYKDELEENDEYNRPARELKEDYDHEKVYKYEPYEIEFMLDGHQVYGMLGDEWVRIGRLKKNARTDGELKCYLYVNEFKYVTEDEVIKDKGYPYFGIESKRIVVEEPHR